MPHYVWKGVNLHARVLKGVYFAPSVQELESILFKKEIALLACWPKKLWRKNISLDLKISYFTQIFMLIQSGMRLPDALTLVAGQMHHAYFAFIAHEIAQKVNNGHSFSSGLKSYPSIFNSLMIQLVQVGEESGSLTSALQVLLNHLEEFSLFKTRLRSALFMPLITFCFFITIIITMLLLVVPQFEHIFKSMHKELPDITKTILGISSFVRGYGIFILVSITMLGLILYRYAQTENGKKLLDKLIIRLPLFNQIIINKTMASFFQALSLLVEGGMPLVKAMAITKASIGNTLLKKHIDMLQEELNSGYSFDQAMTLSCYFCTQEIICLIKIGQEAGIFTIMTKRIAGIYQQKLIKTLNRINALLGPVLLLILGFLIAGLILALYTPIMNLSAII